MIEKALKAGRAAAQARNSALSTVKQGVTFLEAAEKIESEILKRNCGIAFPCNISVNEVAAHDTAGINDSRIFRKGDLVKVDVGAHFEGVCADTAMTVEVGSSKSRLVKCANECLEKGLEQVKPGSNISSVGRAVQEVVDSYGFSVVKNLVGHGLGDYTVHTGVSIPNYRNNVKGVFREGDLVALEPYVTEGVGKSVHSSGVEIYSLKHVKPVRIRKARQLLDWVVSNRKSLPFCKRWLTGYCNQLDFILRILVSQGVLEQYPVLKEVSGKKVAQREDTILVLDNPIITTK